MGKDGKWERTAERTYAYEDEMVLATLTLSDRLIDSEDVAPQIYRYRRHRVRIVDKETGMEDICSHPAKGDSANEEIAWANRMIRKYLSEIRPSN